MINIILTCLMLAFDRNANQTLMCWLKEIEICLWPLIETYLLSEFCFIFKKVVQLVFFFHLIQFHLHMCGNRAGAAFQRALLVRNELCKFRKRAARWDVDGLGSAAGINYGNVGYFAAAPQLNLNVWWEWWWWWWSMVMMMVDYGDGDGDGDGDGGGDGR